MHAKLALSILFVLLGVASWWLFAVTSARPESAAPVPVPASGFAPESSAVDQATDPEGDTSLVGGGNARLIDIDYGGRVEASPAGASVIEVEVTDAVTGDPVPLAEIRWVGVGRTPSSAMFTRLSDPSQLEELIASRGRRTTADAAGHARLSPFNGYGVITASAEGRWGHRRVPLSAIARQRIALYPDGELRVQVIDSNGNPMPGRRVELLRQSKGSVHAAASASTDEREGIATIHHAGWAMSRDPDSEWHVALEDPMRKVVRAPISRESISGASVRLIHPDTGEVEVLVIDPNGRPARGRVLVGLEGGEGAISQDQFAADGSALFFQVDLGFELTCSAMRGFLGDSMPTTSVRGPVRPGERVRAEIRMGTAHPIVVGRLLLAADKPFHRRYVQARLVRDTAPTLSETSVSIEKDGRFQIDLPKFDSLSTKQILTLSWKGSTTHPPSEVTRTLRGVPSSGFHDLGDLQLAAVPMLASGMVLDREGQPAARLHISVLDAEWTNSSELRWFLRPDLATESRSDGSFEVRGQLGFDRLRLFLVATSEREVEVPVGAEGVVLQHIPRGKIAGSVARRDRHLDLKIECRPSVLLETRHGADDGPTLRRNGQSFVFDEVPPGNWTVSLAVDANSAPFLEVYDVVVESGEVSRDPRLKRIQVSSLSGR